LIDSLNGVTVGKAISDPNEDARMILAELRREASIQKAHESPKMFQTKKAIGESTLHKILCFMLKVFQDSLKITNPANELSASEIFECGDMLMGTQVGQYGYESVFDVLMAFQHFKQNPFELYNAFSETTLRKILTAYLTAKADFLERINSAPAREARQKPPLTVAQVHREYSLSQAGLPTNGDVINEQRRIEELSKPRNWRKDETYRFILARRNWKSGYPVEDVAHEDVTDQPQP
jgi:hypothetical protein